MFAAMEVAGQGLRKVIAGNVRRLRKLHGWSQDVFADACGLHRTYVGAIERAERNVSIDNIERMAEALQVPGWRLLHPDADPN